MASAGDRPPPEKPARRSRSRHAGSITSYVVKSGQRWKFQIYVPKDLNDLNSATPA
ncbi:MAG: hypothetical protein ABIN79_08885 [Marmoricola sp.]